MHSTQNNIIEDVVWRDNSRLASSKSMKLQIMYNTTVLRLELDRLHIYPIAGCENSRLQDQLWMLWIVYE